MKHIEKDAVRKIYDTWYGTWHASSNNVGQEEEKEEEKEKEENKAKNEFLKSNLNRQPVVPTKQQVWEVFQRSGGTKEMAKSFYEKHDSTGWFLNGSPIINVTSLANKFIDSWKRNEKKDSPNPLKSPKLP